MVTQHWLARAPEPDRTTVGLLGAGPLASASFLPSFLHLVRSYTVVESNDVLVPWTSA